MLLNTAELQKLFFQYNAAFQNAFNGVEPKWNQIATLVPSVGESNFYAFLGQFPKLRKWIGERTVKSMATHNYSVVNDDYEATIAVPRNKIEDDTYGVFTPMMSEMGWATRMHPDEVVFALLAAGASTLCYDKQFFFDTDHPVTIDGVTSSVSNYDSSSGGNGNLWVLMDTRRPLKPLIYQERKAPVFQAFNKPSDEHVFMQKEFLFGVDSRDAAGFGLWQLAYGSVNALNSTNFETYLAAMMALKSDEGKPLGVRPNLCVVGPSNYVAARNLFEVPTLTGGAANPNYKMCDVLMSEQLT